MIGCGRKATQFARAYSLDPDTQIVAAADPDPWTLELLCERFGVPGYADNDEMVQKEKIDIAACFVPTGAAPEVIVNAVRAGAKAVHRQKPISATLEDADLMVDECRALGVPFAAGDADRNYPQFWKALEIIDSGEIGAVQSINLYQPTDQIWGAGSQGLALLQMFAYDAPVDWVTGWVEGDPNSDDDQGMGGYARFETGIDGFIHLRKGAKKGVEVVCERGVFASDTSTFHLWRTPDGSAPGSLADLEEVDGLFPPSGVGQRGYDEEGWLSVSTRHAAGVRSVVEALELGIEPRCNGHVIRNALEIAIALRESHRLGHAAVKLPLQDRSLKIMPSKAKYVSKKELYGQEWWAKEMAQFKARIHRRTPMDGVRKAEGG